VDDGGASRGAVAGLEGGVGAAEVCTGGMGGGGGVIVWSTMGRTEGSFISNESPVTGAIVLVPHRTIADSVPFGLISLLRADVRCLPFGLISLLRSDVAAVIPLFCFHTGQLNPEPLFASPWSKVSRRHPIVLLPHGTIRSSVSIPIELRQLIFHVLVPLGQSQALIRIIVVKASPYMLRDPVA
jgi:hypothetical protein